MFVTFEFESMKEIIVNIGIKSKYFLLLYFGFLISVGFVLANYSKSEGTVLVNGTWTPFQDEFFKYLTHLGGGQTAIVIVLILIMFVSIRKGVIALSSFVFTALFTQFLKHVIYPDVMRPFIGLWHGFKSGDLHLVLPEELMRRGNSFPSGHTTSAFSVFLILVLFMKRPIWGIVLGVFAILASYSRIYLSQHYFEDVFLGSIIGVSGTLFVYFLFENYNWLSSINKPLIKLKK